MIESKFPDWSWSPNKDDWERNVSVLHEFISVYGHARVPVEFVMGEIKIGAWVSNAKTKYKAGKLTDEQIKDLEKSHPTWTWTLLDQQWEELFSMLENFKEAHGHCNVGSKGKTKEERALYEWVNTQRKRFKQDKLPEARKGRLQALGFSFEPIDPWVESYEVLVAYVAREGNANVPVNHIEDGYFLGRWASKMRGSYKAKELSPEQVELLEKLDGWNWDRSSKK
jgi:hypothetical protein